MLNIKTGVNTGTIIHVENTPIMKKVRHKSNTRQKRAEICIKCESNSEGYCSKHKNWCGRVNYICLGISNPYDGKVPKYRKKSSKDRKAERKASNLTDKQIASLAKRYKISACIRR